MKPRIVRKCWTQFLIAFGDGYTLDGFKKTEKHLELPENLLRYEARLKRELTICNLFANQNQSISSIARVLDMKYGQVVTTLIDHGFIKERRRTIKKLEVEASPQLLAAEIRGHNAIDQAATVGSEQAVALAAHDVNEKKFQGMLEILDIKWPEHEKFFWSGSLADLSLSNSSVRS